MARAGIPHPRLGFGVSQRRWALHAAVLLLVSGAVFYGLLSRAGVEERPPVGGGAPPAGPEPTVPAPIVLPSVALSPGPAAPAEPEPTATPLPSPSPAPSPSPSPEPTPAPPPEPAPSPAPVPSLAPTPSPAPAPAPTAAPAPPTPRPVVTARALDTAALRTSPSQEAIIAGYLPPGTVVSVIGCAAGCSWLQVVTPSGTLWSARYFWSVQGDLSIFGGR